VEAEAGHGGASDDPVEELAERFGVEVPTCGVAEHPLIGAAGKAVSAKLAAPRLQQVHGRLVQVNAAAAVASLDAELDRPPADALQGPLD
jgi:hypothetical protein